MKFLADAHVSTEMVAMLREFGHECLDASSIPPRMPDVDVLRQAADEGRIVVTADKDFGELVFLHRIACPGVILLRIDRANETERVAVLRDFMPILAPRLPGSFITVTATGIRARPLA